MDGCRQPLVALSLWSQGGKEGSFQSLGAAGQKLSNREPGVVKQSLQRTKGSRLACRQARGGWDYLEGAATSVDGHRHRRRRVAEKQWTFLVHAGTGVALLGTVLR